MNRILSRLEKKYLSSFEKDKNISEFLSEIDDVLTQKNKDVEFIQRTLRLSSEELNEINSSLRNDKAELSRIISKQKALFDASQEAVFSFNLNNEIDHLNHAGLHFLHLDEALNHKVLTCELFMRRIKDREKFSEEINPIRENEMSIVQGIFETIDGRFHEYYSVPERLGNVLIGRVWCCRDITDIRRNESLLEHQANHDALTNLPNRMMLNNFLDHAIASSKRSNTKVAVIFVDLDDFKKINDTAGHQEGDRYLIEFSEKLKVCLREEDFFGRLGGDEFLIILENITDATDIIKINEKILSLCKKPFYVSEKQYHISCSIGVSISPDDSISSSELIRKADMSMYQAKKMGKNKYHFFDKNLESIALNKVLIENDLRSAIENDEFVLHFQPKIDFKTSSISGVEALIRWQKGDDLIYPDQFIPVAEDTGLIREITYWLIKECCKKLSSWEDTVLDGISMSLNISAIDFSDNFFIENAFKIIDESKVNCSLIEFELTESVLFEDLSSAKENVKKIKSRNINISIDDFGTGFSSFSYLLDMEIDFLKIDKSFVMSALRDKKAKAIVKSIIDIGINLGLKVVAEGIETEDDFSFLESEGCHLGQGYFMSRPLAERNLIKFAEET